MAGALLALFWSVIALIGAMCASAMISAMRGGR